MPPPSSDLADLRRDYCNQPLCRANLASDPIEQFRHWFEEALAAEAMDANAMTLATAGHDGQPAARTVLLKSFDENGFVFYTNFGSHKARDLAENPQAALLFYWHEVHRQVLVRGRAAQVAIEESRRYFARRPRDSQIGAWTSHQSTVIKTRQVLEQRYDELQQRFAEQDVPLPEFWGGYRVRPQAIEFWQGRENRLHDRFLYTANPDSGWHIDRLSP